MLLKLLAAAVVASTLLTSPASAKMYSDAEVSGSVNTIIRATERLEYTFAGITPVTTLGVKMLHSPINGYVYCGKLQLDKYNTEVGFLFVEEPKELLFIGLADEYISALTDYDTKKEAIANRRAYDAICTTSEYDTLWDDRDFSELFSITYLSDRI